MTTTFEAGPFHQANGSHTHKHSRHQHSHKRHGTEQSLNGSFSITMPQTDTTRFAARTQNDFAFNRQNSMGSFEHRFADQNAQKHHDHDHENSHNHNHSVHAGPLQELQYTNGVVHAVTPPRMSETQNHSHRRPESLSIKPAPYPYEDKVKAELYRAPTIKPTAPHSRATAILLRVFAEWPLIHGILVEKDSRRIMYFMCLNLGFMLIQTFYAFVTGSLGLLSDSIHMLFDCLALVVGLSAAVMSKWPPSVRFPYGFGKMDTLAGFANGIFLMLISLEIVYESIERLVDGLEMQRIGELLTVSTLGFAVNLVGILAFGHAHHGHSHDHGHSHESHEHEHSHEESHGHHYHDEKPHHHHHHHDDEKHAHHHHELIAPSPIPTPMILQHSPANSVDSFQEPHILHSELRQDSYRARLNSVPTIPEGNFGPSVNGYVAKALPPHQHDHKHNHHDKPAQKHDSHSHSHSHAHHHHHNENMHGIFLHVLADTLGSFAVVLSTILIHYTGWYGFDPLASCIIAILIFASAIPLVSSSAKQLLMAIPNNTEFHLRESLSAVSGTRGVVGLRAPKFWLPGGEGGDINGVVHVVASKGSDFEDVRSHVESELRNRGLDVVVSVEKEDDLSCWCRGEAARRPPRDLGSRLD